jgi:hypothetical protein
VPSQIGVIDQFVSAPLGVLLNWVDGNGPFASGDHTLTDWKKGGVSVPLAITYGVLVIINGAIPPEWGFTLGAGLGGSTPFNGESWQPRIAQLVVQHQLNVLGGGPFVTTQITNTFQTGTLVMWNIALPGKLGLYVAPGISVDLQFLQTP